MLNSVGKLIHVDAQVDTELRRTGFVKKGTRVPNGFGGLAIILWSRHTHPVRFIGERIEEFEARCRRLIS